MKRALLVLLLSTLGWAAPTSNWNGFLDTAIISGFRADSLDYSKTFRLTDFEDGRFVILADDTSSAGYASDSVQFYFGYQTGAVVLDTSGARDTAWDSRVVLDTMHTDSFGIITIGRVDSTGALIRELNDVDTLNVNGYAYMSKWFVPEWDVLIRLWFKGVVGKNKKGADVSLRAHHERRLGVGVRKK